MFCNMFPPNFSTCPPLIILCLLFPKKTLTLQPDFTDEVPSVNKKKNKQSDGQNLGFSGRSLAWALTHWRIITRHEYCTGERVEACDSTVYGASSGGTSGESTERLNSCQKKERREGGTFILIIKEILCNLQDSGTLGRSPV